MLFYDGFCDGRKYRRRYLLAPDRPGPVVLFLLMLCTVQVAPAEPNQDASAKPKNRAESVRAVMAHLGVGKGSVVADVWAGRGADTWVFADIVCEKGTV